ncbi:MAG: Hsp20/alpha crystallin family protein [Firmicutes bacterium]|nr:Hsp20/alpha crystallin family protein [Bacillota bacterium]
MFDLVPFRRRGRHVMGVDDVFDQFINNFFTGVWGVNNLSGFKADIRETDDAYIVEAELPGLAKDMIDVEYKDNYLTIKAENKEIYENKNANFIRRERRYGKFQRCFYVDSIDADKISAKYEHGVLTVTLPKTEPGRKGRKIEIN